MTAENLGPKPEAFTEEPERLPGGADSVADDKYGSVPQTPTVPDLDPDANPAVDEQAPEEIKEQDDKQQAPDSAEAEDREAGTEAPGQEGQSDEQGQPEPPA